MRSRFKWLFVLCIAVMAGCSRSEVREKSESPKPPPTTARPASLFRCHFAGTTRLAADTNAATWVSMSALPASEALWQQTVEKLSRAPHQLFQQRIAAPTNDHANIFQAIIADFVRAESFTEVTGDTNHITECELAVRLPADRAEFWRTNLLAILESWTGCRGEDVPVLAGARGGSASSPAAVSGWQLKKHHNPNLFRLVRCGNWTLIGCGQDELPSQDEHWQRIKQTGNPVAQSDPLLGGGRGGSWLEVFLDLPNLPMVLSSAFRRSDAANPPEGGTPNSQPSTLDPQRWLNGLPAVSLAVTGRGSNLRLEGDFAFREPFSWKPESWQIPTNLIRDPIISFTAVQGLAPILKSNQEALGLRSDPIPNQLFVWSGAALPVGTLAAMPVNDAAETLRHLAPQLIRRFNPELQALNAGALVITTNLAGLAALRWTDIPPFVTPFVAPVQDAGREFLLAGILPNWGGDSAPPVVFEYLNSRTNLVYYDWEITGPHAGSWRVAVNIFRHIMEKPRLGPDTASIRWINSISNNVSNTITEVTRSDANRLSLIRQGPVALTSLELIALAHWLESTNFPLNGITLPGRTNGVTGDK